MVVVTAAAKSKSISRSRSSSNSSNSNGNSSNGNNNSNSSSSSRRSTGRSGFVRLSYADEGCATPHLPVYAVATERALSCGGISGWRDVINKFEVEV